MITVSCPVLGCEGEFDLEVESGWQGDSSMPNGTAPIMEWTIVHDTCEHHESEFTPQQEQRFADDIYERIIDPEP